MVYGGAYRHQNIIFEGNSIMNYNAGSTVTGQHYIPQQVFTSLTGLSKCCYHSFALSGQSQAQINALITTNIVPLANEGDIIVLWEGHNQLFTDGLTGQQCYDEVVTYSQAVRSRGIKLVLATIHARDYATDPADLMTRLNDFNVLLRNNQGSICDAFVDIAADVVFDERADASNTTYYHADKAHLVTAGQDRAATLIKNKLQSLIT